MRARVCARSSKPWTKRSSPLCQRYCEIGPHEFEFGCAPLHRMVLIATPRVKALISALNSYTLRLNAFLDGRRAATAELTEVGPIAAWLRRILCT
jgi:hypothetical protein